MLNCNFFSKCMYVCTMYVFFFLDQGAIVLDCVVERKSYPDLCCSIMV